jgi:uncharacterized protein with ATP-grasp and redox domains
MNLKDECVGCIVDQSRRVAQTIGASSQLTQTIVAHVETMSKTFNFHHSPPEVATPIYEAMANIAQKDDLYDQVKTIATNKAKAFVPTLQKALAHSEDAFATATKIAVAGNVIDLAVPNQFRLEDELATIFSTQFSIDHVEKLFTDLSNAKRVLYLADNAGEHIFDKLHIEVIAKLFPQIHITYATRGNAIINDVTYEEALRDELDEYATVISSGVPSPGFIPKWANAESLELFNGVDVIIAKGMGNYETLSDQTDKPLYFLLKVKCNVVANSLALNVGDIICKKIGETS